MKPLPGGQTLSTLPNLPGPGGEGNGEIKEKTEQTGSRTSYEAARSTQQRETKTRRGEKKANLPRHGLPLRLHKVPGWDGQIKKKNRGRKCSQLRG